MLEHILSIDVGTQSVRALLYDIRGALTHKVQIPIEAYFSERPGWAEQRADYFWDSLCAACKQLWDEAADVRDSVVGVTLTTQRGTVVNVDRDGVPLRPAISWLDQRRTDGLASVGGVWGLLFRISRMTDTIAYLQAEAESNWISRHQPEIWERTHKFLFLSGYLLFRMVGRFVDSVGSQVGYVPFDYKHLKWAKQSEWKWRALSLDLERMPELVSPGNQLGEITRIAAKEMGIPAGLPVFAAAADKACEVLGSGGLDPRNACLSFGTIGTVNTISRRYVELIPLIPPFPCAVPGSYALEHSIFRGFWMVTWFKRELGLQERELARERGVSAEELFDELVAATPPGSMGLMLQPYWTPGIKNPGPEAKGAIIGFGDVHTRAHMYRAILEGLAYALRAGLDRIQKRTGFQITELRVSGGGSQSDAAMQIAADVFNLPASRPHTFETSGLGAAIDAAVGLKWHPDFETAAAEMTRVSQTFEPNRESSQVYDELYRCVYKPMYKRLRPLYREIRRITGYPP